MDSPNPESNLTNLTSSPNPPNTTPCSPTHQPPSYCSREVQTDKISYPFPPPTIFRSPYARYPPNVYIPDYKPVPQSLIDEARSKVVWLEHFIRGVQGYKDVINRAVDRHISYSSPVHRLPDEVILLIITELWRNPGAPSFRHYDERRCTPPWAAAGVCKRWRAVACSCSLLWTRFCHDSHSSDVERGRQFMGFLLHRMKVQFERAASRPLRGEISFHTCKQITAEGIYHFYLDTRRLFVKHLHRFETLKVYGNVQEFAEDFPSHPPEFSHLKKLSIHNDQLWTDLAGGLFVNAPNLRDVQLHSLERTLRKPILLPWSQLHTLEIHNSPVTIPALLDILDLAVNLSALLIDSPHVVTTDDPIPDMVLLPKLEKLSLIQHTPVSVVDRAHALKSHILAPALLTFHGEEDGLRASYHYYTFLSDSVTLGRLLSLTLNCQFDVFVDSMSSFAELLRDMHALEDLVFNHRPGFNTAKVQVNADDLLDVLSRQDVCPRLKRFELKGFEITPDELYGALETRLDLSSTCKPGETSIEKIVVQYTNFPDPVVGKEIEWIQAHSDALELLQEICETGLLTFTLV